MLCAAGFLAVSLILWRRLSASRASLAEARRKTRDQASKYQAIFQAAGEGIFLSRPSGELIEANPAFVHVFGCKDIDELMAWAGPNLGVLYKNPEDRRLLVDQVLTQGRELGREVRMRKIGGQVIWTRLSVTRHLDRDSGEVLLLGVLQDITDQRQCMLDLEYRATRDPLTGLPNRHLFLDRMAKTLANAKRHGRKVGLLFIDLNDFKCINDAFGHQVGDQVLQTVGERILRRTREADTAARIGGDEFAVILDNVDGEQAAAKVAWEMGAMIRRPYVLDSVEYSVGASIGICMFPDDGEDGHSLLRLSDQAMYMAKGQGRDYCFCSELNGLEQEPAEQDGDRGGRS
ncbi:MAG: diguanylate cyclase domain-containing protein [Desulfovibrionaceae bacterium]